MMPIRLRWLVALAAALLVATPLSATPIDALALQAHSWEDLNATATFANVPQEAFTPWQRPILSLGYTQSALWLRLNPPAAQQERFLVFDKPILMDAQVALVRQGQIVWQAQQGLNYGPREEGERLYRLTLPPTQAGDQLFVQYHSESALVAGPTLWQPIEYFQAQAQDRWLWGLFFGVMVVMGLYNLFLYLTVKDQAYLAYVLFLVFITLFQYLTRGFTLPFWPLERTDQGIILAASLTTLFGILFLFRFVDLPRTQPYMAWIGWSLALEMAILALLSFWPSHQLYDVMVHSINFSVAYGLVASLRGFVKGQKEARLYVIASISMLLGTMTYILALEGHLPYTRLTSHAQALGCLFEVTLFSLALAERIQALRREKEAAQAMALEIQAKYTQSLEAEVARRTEELTLANDTKDRFFALIAHDLRGPIGSQAVLFNEMIHSGEELTPELFSHLRHSTKTTSELLNDLLLWARNQRGELLFEPKHLDLSEVANSVLMLHEQSASQKRIQLSQQLPEECYLLADLGMTATILRNLLSNAIKFTPEGGLVVLRAFEQGDFWRIEVQDNGIGIPPEKAPHLFELAPARAILTEGSTSTSGLGLALCKDFTQKHGGLIGYQAIAEGGSLFWLTLPKGQRPPAPQHDWHGCTAWLIESNPLHQHSISRTLSNFGLEVVMLDSSEAALSQSTSARPSLIFLDLDSAGHTASEKARQLRAHLHEASQALPPILGLTCHSRVEAQQRFGQGPFLGFLEKPLRSDLLFTTLAGLPKAAFPSSLKKA